MVDQIDQVEKAKGRFITQYKESNLIDYQRPFSEELNELEQVIQDINLTRSIDDASGVNLDVIGRIVGQPRIVINASDVTYFGFNGASNADSFGTVEDNSVGGIWKSGQETTDGFRLLTDTEYRFYLKARIFRNYMYPNINQLNKFYSLFFGVETIHIVDGRLEYQVNIGRILNDNEKNILLNADIMPEVVGVIINYGEYDGTNVFGFLEDPNSKGFGDDNDPDVGGTFASDIL